MSFGRPVMRGKRVCKNENAYSEKSDCNELTQKRSISSQK